MEEVKAGVTGEGCVLTARHACVCGFDPSSSPLERSHAHQHLKLQSRAGHSAPLPRHGMRGQGQVKWKEESRS